MPLTRTAAALALALLLAACGGAAAPSTPTPPPPTEAAPPSPAPSPAPPTAEPAAEPTAEPAAEPTATASDELPAALLFIDRAGQVARLEPDGVTVTRLTDEDGQVIEFALAGRSLAYVVVGGARGQKSRLVAAAADGSGRTELLAGVLRGVALQPDGQRAQVGVLDEPAESAAGPLDPGVWSIPLAGGQPEPLQAAAPMQGDAAGTNYQPIAWSPDGRLLLLRTAATYGPDAPSGDLSSTGLALLDTAGGATRDLVPVGGQPLCAQPVWARASDAVYCPNFLYTSPTDPALWRLALAGGAPEPLVAGTTGPDSYTLVAGAAELADGVYALVGTSTPSQSAELFSVRRFAPGGAAEDVIADQIPAGFGALFAPDGSGVVAGAFPAGADAIELLWHPFGDGPTLKLPDAGGSSLAWIAP